MQALFLFKIFTFLFRLFWSCKNTDWWEREVQLLDKVRFKTFEVTDWQTNNYNTCIAQTMKFVLLIECSARNMFLQRSSRKWVREASPHLFCFLRQLYIKTKQKANTLLLIYFGRLPLGMSNKANFITFHIVNLEIFTIL